MAAERNILKNEERGLLLQLFPGLLFLSVGRVHRAGQYLTYALADEVSCRSVSQLPCDVVANLNGLELVGRGFFRGYVKNSILRKDSFEDLVELLIGK